MKSLSRVGLLMILCLLLSACSTTPTEPEIIKIREELEEHTIQKEKKQHPISTQTIMMGPFVSDIESQRQVQRYAFRQDKQQEIKLHARQVTSEEIDAFKLQTGEYQSETNRHGVEIIDIPCNPGVCRYVIDGHRRYELSWSTDRYQLENPYAQKVSDLITSFFDQLRFATQENLDVQNPEKLIQHYYSLIQAHQFGQAAMLATDQTAETLRDRYQDTSKIQPHSFVYEGNDSYSFLVRYSEGQTTSNYQVVKQIVDGKIKHISSKEIAGTEVYDFIDTLRTGSRNDSFNAQDVEIIKKNLETIKQLEGKRSRQEEEKSLTQHEVSVVFEAGEETVTTSFDPQRETHIQDKLIVIKDGEKTTFDLSYRAMNQEFVNKKDYINIASLSKLRNISPSGYYLAYDVSDYECSWTELVDLETGKRAAKFPSAGFPIWTNDKKQLILGAHSGMCQEPGLYVTRKGDFPKYYKLSDEAIEAVYVDDRYIYALTHSADTPDQSFVRIYNLSNSLQVY